MVSMPGGGTLKNFNLRRLVALAGLVLAGVTAIAANGWCGESPNQTEQTSSEATLYRLGPGDQIQVHQPNAEELDSKLVRIDDLGYADFPLIGRVKLGELTLEQAESLIASHLSRLLVNPQPVLSITEYRSQPVSVLGAVNNPGVIQLQGKRTLVEVLSLAGGLRPDAGGEVVVTRRLGYGRVPVGVESLDASGNFSTARIDVAALETGAHPTDNILIYPQDVISVPSSEFIYVTGEVHKPGSFPIRANGGISVLQAISLAEGLVPQASAKNAKIFRERPGNVDKEEIQVDVARILAGKNRDIQLEAHDILFIPDSVSKKAGYRVAEAAIQTATGIAIWGR
jgi:polysaccharide biosynthesis/export protein